MISSRFSSSHVSRPFGDFDRHALAFFSEALEHVTEQARCSPLDRGDEDGQLPLRRKSSHKISVSKITGMTRCLLWVSVQASCSRSNKLAAFDEENPLLRS